MKFHEHLKSERKRIGLTQTDCAAALAVTLRTYQYWESGEKSPSPLTQEGALARLKQLPNVTSEPPGRRSPDA